MQRGLHKIKRRNGRMSNDYLDPARASGGLRLNPRFAIAKENQQTPIGPRMFHRNSHKLVDQFGKHDLT